MKISASSVENAVIDYFRKRGGYARKIHVTPIPVRRKVNGKWIIAGQRKNPKMRGMADVMALLAGVPYRIEVKRPGDTEKKHQEEDRLGWEKSGGRSLIIRDIDDFLEQIG